MGAYLRGESLRSPHTSRTYHAQHYLVTHKLGVSQQSVFGEALQTTRRYSCFHLVEEVFVSCVRVVKDELNDHLAEVDLLAHSIQEGAVGVAGRHEDVLGIGSGEAYQSLLP